MFAGRRCVLYKCHDCFDQLLDAPKRPSTYSLIGNLSEPALDQIQPGTTRRDEVKMEPRMPFAPRHDLGVFVRRIVVHDQMQVQFRWRFSVDQFEELDPFLVPMLGHASPDQLSFRQLDRSEKSGCTVALVIMRHSAATSLMDRQAALRAVQCLDLCLLIRRYYKGMFRRIEVQSNHIYQFLHEVWVVAEFECSRQVWLQPVSLPHPLDHRSRRAQVLRQCPRAPVGG